MPDQRHDHPVYPVRLEIRRDPQNPERSTHFISGRPVTSHAYKEFTRDLFLRVAREQTLLVLIEPVVVPEELCEDGVILAEPPGMITVHTDDLHVSLLPLVPIDATPYLTHSHSCSHEHECECECGCEHDASSALSVDQSTLAQERKTSEAAE